jgi:hypothetical protein
MLTKMGWAIFSQTHQVTLYAELIEKLGSYSRLLNIDKAAWHKV